MSHFRRLGPPHISNRYSFLILIITFCTIINESSLFSISMATSSTFSFPRTAAPTTPGASHLSATSMPTRPKRLSSTSTVGSSMAAKSPSNSPSMVPTPSASTKVGLSNLLPDLSAATVPGEGKLLN
ncbi:hypothetical protein HN51_041203 [Arachis hypogaea]